MRNYFDYISMVSFVYLEAMICERLNIKRESTFVSNINLFNEVDSNMQNYMHTKVDRLNII